MASTSVLKLVVDSKEYNAGLKQAQAGLQALERSLHDSGKSFADVDKEVVEYVRAIGQMESTAKNSRGALRDMSNALTELTVKYRGLSDEEKESPFGKALAESMQQLTERAGAISDAMGDVQREISGIASDTRLFDQLSQGAQVATAGIQTLTGTFKLLGIDIGDDVKVIATLQSAMAVTNGLTTLQNALQKESALMMGVSALQAKAAAAAQAMLAKNTAAATVAQRAFNAIAKANPYVLLASAIGSVVGALALFSSGTDEATASTSRFANVLDGIDDRLDDLKRGFQDTLKYMQEIGASTATLNDIRYQQADQELQAALGEYKKLMSSENKNGMFSAVGRQLRQMTVPEDVQQQALERVNKARKALADAERDRRRTTNVGNYFNENWNSLNTEKEISAAITYFKNLRSEMERGSKEYEDMTKRIDALSKKVKTASKGGDSNTVKTEEQKIQKQITDLEQEAYKASDERRKAITMEISGLQAQLDIYKEIRDEVHGIKKEEKTLPQSMSRSEEFFNDIQSDIAFSNQQKMKDSLTNVVRQAMINGLTIPQDIVNGILYGIFEEGSLPQDLFNDLIKKFSEEWQQKGGKALRFDVSSGSLTDKEENPEKKKKEDSEIETYQKFTSGLSQVSSGLQQMGAKLPDGVQKIIGFGQGLISIIQGVQSVITLFNTTTSAAQVASATANTTALVANTAAMVSLTTAIGINSAVSAIPFFSNGGTVGFAASGMVIPGTSYSGDNLRMPVVGGGMIGVNSGEVILNAAQAGVVADALSHNTSGAVEMQPWVDGERLFLGMNNTSKRMGQGEIVTTGTLRRLGLIN